LRAGSRREGERGLREEGEAARGGGGAPVWIPPGSIEREGELPVGSVERKGKVMCEGERGREGCWAHKGNGNRP